ncbi:MAG: type I restriction enzyme endonuclease domain-containing protein [Erythrobacter sp.]
MGRNRRADGKTSGVIVDYVGVFNNLQKALAIYAGGAGGGDTPIKDKAALVTALEAALQEAEGFAEALEIDLAGILDVPQGLERAGRIRKAVEALVAPDERRRDFLRLTANVTKAYKALLPDERASPFLRRVAVLHVVAQSVKAKLGPADIEKLSALIAELLDDKIEGVAILAPIVEGDGKEGRVDLSEIDFDKLGELFADSPKVRPPARPTRARRALAGPLQRMGQR